ncbi:hypothetical protein Agub_g3433 [Astrephomene gubernaculifera]|uniref:Uncharacterized protein n=1 Tax=Astrephomene gubernaculifera TaxID=47775 RepID=A0AAD3DIN1_9CHLO|nr:hypothetical protein Agub_g3433 [Astrephomene gubernaculifera]
MACLAHRPYGAFRGAHGHQSCVARVAGVPSVPRTICHVAAGYKSRIVEEQETREYKIRKLAEILETSTDKAASLVKLRPGLLVVPNGDMSFYEQRVSMLAFKHGVSPRQAAAMVLEDPSLLFHRA